MGKEYRESIEFREGGIDRNEGETSPRKSMPGTLTFSGVCFCGHHVNGAVRPRRGSEITEKVQEDKYSGRRCVENRRSHKEYDRQRKERYHLQSHPSYPGLIDDSSSCVVSCEPAKIINYKISVVNDQVTTRIYRLEDRTTEKFLRVRVRCELKKSSPPLTYRQLSSQYLLFRKRLCP